MTTWEAHTIWLDFQMTHWVTGHSELSHGGECSVMHFKRSTHTSWPQTHFTASHNPGYTHNVLTLRLRFFLQTQIRTS